MPRWRQLTVSAFVLFLLAGVGYCAATGEYAWPFSPHPMYPFRQGKTYGTQLLYGVSERGELRITSQVSPMGQDTLRKALSGMKGARQRRALDTFFSIYEKGRAQHPGDALYPELLALRVYGSTWDIQSWAKNKDTPNKRLISSRLFPTARLQSEFDRQRANQAFSDAELQGAGNGDIVIDLSEAHLHSASGAVRFDADVNASGALVAAFPPPAKGVTPGSLEIDFEADAARYYVWLRGTSAGGSKQDSVLLELDGKRNDIEAKRGHGFGNWQSRFPSGVYAWSSELPDYPPSSIRIRKAGRHRIRIIAREGGSPSGPDLAQPTTE